MTRAVTILIIVLVGSLLAPPTTAAQPVKRVEYYHLDALGSVRVVTDQQGHEIARHDYLPFGEEWPQATFKLTPLFTGKQRDTESGLDYFGARYYEQRAAAFTTTDPLLDIDAAMVDPQRWNRYAYALNRPYRYVDPDGANPIYLYQLLQRAASSPLAQKAQQIIVSQASHAWVALTRLFNTPQGQELVETAAQLTIGADLGPTAGSRAANIGAVIGHYDAGYVNVGRGLGVAVFDIPIDIWNRMTPDQRNKANQAFLDGIIEKGLSVKIVTEGFIRLGSQLQLEIEYLLSKGYRLSKNGDLLLPPK